MKRPKEYTPEPWWGIAIKILACLAIAFAFCYAGLQGCK